MGEMLINVLPDIASKIAEPLAAIDKVTIIGGGEGESGVSSIGNNVPMMMSKLFASVEEATGIDLKEIVRADSYDAKVNRNISIAGAVPVEGIEKGAEPDSKDEPITVFGEFSED